MSNVWLRMKSALFSIQTVSRRTGLSRHSIRAWEKRYGAVKPARSATGQRRYSEADIQRLIQLERLTRAGHSIGTVVSLPGSQLRQLLSSAGQPAAADTLDASLDRELRGECIAAVRAMDEAQLAAALEKALLRLGHQGLLGRVCAPLAEQIGELWRQGEITAAHEHFFTAVARTFFGNIAQQFAIAPDAPALIAATPVGQHHELGAFMAAVCATHLGWRAIYLGPSLPSAEIAGAVLQVDAPVLVLSIVYPADDRHLLSELRALRKRLPATNLLVGGRSARSYRPTLKAIQARLVEDIAQLGDELDAIRAASRVPNISQANW